MTRSEQMEQLEQLKAAYLAAEKARELAWKAFEESAIEANDWHLGDTVEVNTYSRTKVGRVMKIFLKRDWRDKTQFSVCGSAYPIKKNGETAVVGEIELGYPSDKITVLESAL